MGCHIQLFSNFVMNLFNLRWTIIHLMIYDTSYELCENVIKR